MWDSTALTCIGWQFTTKAKQWMKAMHIIQANIILMGFRDRPEEVVTLKPYLSRWSLQSQKKKYPLTITININHMNSERRNNKKHQHNSYALISDHIFLKWAGILVPKVDQYTSPFWKHLIDDHNPGISSLCSSSNPTVGLYIPTGRFGPVRDR